MSPTLQALLVADHVYQDVGSNKFIISGVFGVLHLHPSPEETAEQAGPQDEPAATGEPPEFRKPISELTAAGSPWAYISLTEIRGARQFEVRYVDLGENKPLFRTRFTITCHDPLETVQLRLPLPLLPAPHEGTFSLELLCDDELLGSHRILVRKREVP